MTLFLILSIAFWLGVAGLVCAFAWENVRRRTLKHWAREMSAAAWIWLITAIVAIVWACTLLVERI